MLLFLMAGKDLTPGVKWTYEGYEDIEKETRTLNTKLLL